MDMRTRISKLISLGIITGMLLTQTGCKSSEGGEGDSAVEHIESPVDDNTLDPFIPENEDEDEVQGSSFESLVAKVFPVEDDRPEDLIQDLVDDMLDEEEHLNQFNAEDIQEDQDQADQLAEQMMVINELEEDEDELSKELSELYQRRDDLRLLKLEMMIYGHLLSKVRHSVKESIRNLRAIKQPIREEIKRLKSERNAYVDKDVKKALKAQIKELWGEIKPINVQIRKRNRIIGHLKGKSKKVRKRLKNLNKKLKKLKKAIRKASK